MAAKQSLYPRHCEEACNNLLEKVKVNGDEAISVLRHCEEPDIFHLMTLWSYFRIYLLTCIAILGLDNGQSPPHQRRIKGMDRV